VCGFAFLHDPLPPRDYWRDEGSTGSDFWTEAKGAYFRSCLGLLAQETRGRRLLDVGGGVGFFAQLALSRGWDAFSVDVSAVATRAAADRLGADRALSSLEGIEPRTFDVATLWCVVAHVDDPVALVRSVARTLRPDGVLWLTTPNFLFQRRYGALRALARRPIDFVADDHRGQFTPAAVSLLLTRSGFDSLAWHDRGVTELCAATMRASRLGVGLKRGWNSATHALAQVGLPNLMSELQVTARASGR
jgi:SAM-dependent methyltransferase